MLFTLIKGILLGFSIAAPVGPIAMLCVRNSLTYGLLPGLMTGLGAALADACYGAIAAFGVLIISNFLVQHNIILNLLGAIFLWYLGVKTFLETPQGKTVLTKQIGLLNIFITTFLLTITNPMTIIMFAGVFAGFGICSSIFVLLPALMLTIGVFLGSMLWWIFLSSFSFYVGKLVDKKFMTLINKISGVILMCFAFYSTLVVIETLVLSR